MTSRSLIKIVYTCLLIALFMAQCIHHQKFHAFFPDSQSVNSLTSLMQQTQEKNKKAGNMGIVHLLPLKIGTEQTLVAVKSNKKPSNFSDLSPEAQKATFDHLNREEAFLWEISEPQHGPLARFFPKYFGCFEAPEGEQNLVMEQMKQLLDFSDQNVLNDENAKALYGDLSTPRGKLMVFARIAEVLAAMHLARFAHNDVKPDSLMLAFSGEIKLIDFGLTKKKTDASSGGTPVFMDLTKFKIRETIIQFSAQPDQQLEALLKINGINNNEKADVWALGITFFLLVAPDQKAWLQSLATADWFPAASRAEAIAKTVTETKWMKAAGLHIKPQNGSSHGFGELMKSIMKIERNERTISAAKIAERLKELAESIGAGEAAEAPEVVDNQGDPVFKDFFAGMLNQEFTGDGVLDFLNNLGNHQGLRASELQKCGEEPSVGLFGQLGDYSDDDMFGLKNDIKQIVPQENVVHQKKKAGFNLLNAIGECLGLKKKQKKEELI